MGCKRLPIGTFRSICRQAGLSPSAFSSSPTKVRTAPFVAAQADDGPVEGVTVTRWRRYGKDRLYVNDHHGRQLGWADLLSGAITAESEWRPVVEQVLRTCPQWTTRWPSATADPDAKDHPSRPMAPLESPGDAAELPALVRSPSNMANAARPLPLDLASKQAGADLRQLAAAERSAHPIRSGLARVFGIHTQERAWRVGAQGEEWTGTRLSRLGPQWSVLHGIPVGENGSDIDHLVIGPGGVFTINTKHHPHSTVWIGGDTVMVAGHKVPYVRNSRFEARRTAKLLTAATERRVVVTAILAVRCDRLTIKKPPVDVPILTQRQLDRWLAHRPPVLSPVECAAIYQAARTTTTWYR